MHFLVCFGFYKYCKENKLGESNMKSKPNNVHLLVTHSCFYVMTNNITLYKIICYHAHFNTCTITQP